MEWVFDGIGTEVIGIIISLIIGTMGGGAIGYKIGSKRTIRQKQISGDYAEQKQELHMGENNAKENSSKSKTIIKQYQKAGDNAVQNQIGEIKDDR